MGIDNEDGALIIKIIDFLRFNGLIGLLQAIVDIVYTTLIFQRRGFFRFPTLIRNRGAITVGKNCRFGRFSTIELFCNDSLLTVGDGFRSNSHLHIGVISSVTIGQNVLVASGVYISDHSHGEYGPNASSDPNTPPVVRRLVSAPVVIGDNVWLGEKVAVLPGVRVGHGVVVGAGSVVTKNIPDYCIAVGVPAKVIKRYDFSTSTWVSV